MPHPFGSSHQVRYAFGHPDHIAPSDAEFRGERDDTRQTGDNDLMSAFARDRHGVE